MTASTPLKGRGALSNPANRYATQCSDYEPDAAPSVVTEVRAEQAKSIIARNRSPDLPFSQSINPYQGCEHGCVYCFARPTHAYWDLSPGLDFETKLSYKANAAELLEQALSRPGYRCRPIALGTNTDPYQPLERDKRVTRELLEVLQRFRHPFTITTKSQLVLRDLDLLAPLAAQRLCRVNISITTLDSQLMRRMEPRAASPAARLHTLRELTAAGVPSGVMVAPLIPSINDAELETILAASREAGAHSAAYILIRLPHEVKALFREWLESHYPGRARHVISLIEQCRDGQLYNARFGERMTGSGVVATLLAKRFEVACRRLGLKVGENGGLDCTRFDNDHDYQQLSFF